MCLCFEQLKRVLLFHQLQATGPNNVLPECESLSLRGLECNKHKLDVFHGVSSAQVVHQHGSPAQVRRAVGGCFRRSYHHFLMVVHLVPLEAHGDKIDVPADLAQAVFGGDGS